MTAQRKILNIKATQNWHPISFWKSYEIHLTVMISPSPQWMDLKWGLARDHRTVISGKGQRHHFPRAKPATDWVVQTYLQWASFIGRSTCFLISHLFVIISFNLKVNSKIWFHLMHHLKIWNKDGKDQGVEVGNYLQRILIMHSLLMCLTY